MTTKKRPRIVRRATMDVSKILEELAGSRLSLGDAIEAVRLSDNTSQTEMARRLGVTSQHLCDIEKGRRLVSPGRAAMFARKLGHSEAVFIKLAVQDQLSSEGLDTKVTVEVA